jgi:hypothetical protein
MGRVRGNEFGLVTSPGWAGTGFVSSAQVDLEVPAAQSVVALASGFAGARRLGIGVGYVAVLREGMVQQLAGALVCFQSNSVWETPLCAW